MTQAITKELNEIQKLVSAAKTILIIQADNPDGDSLASALALEQIVHSMDKEPMMYCGVDMPGYLRYLEGWDRVSNELPRQFDLSIIVDTSTVTLLEKLQAENKLGWVKAKPCVVLDHHESVEAGIKIDFAEVSINEPEASSTGELIYNVATKLGWKIDKLSGAFIMTAILSDTQGLTNDAATADTYRVMTDLVELDISRPELEEKRRELSKMTQSIFKYKAELIKRTEFFANGQLAIVDVPQSEINEYSPQYNPAPLIQSDMLQTENVGVAIVIKSYDGGRITAAIRCNNGFGVAAKIAETFGGGGHEYASGFKIMNGKSLGDVKAECIEVSTKLLHGLSK